MHSTHTAIFTFPHIPIVALQEQIFSALANKSLISIRQLYDNGFTYTFNTTSVYLSDGSTTIWGNRDPKYVLY